MNLKKLKWLYLDDKIIFKIVSVGFAISLLFVNMGFDDINGMKGNGGVVGYWAESSGMYYTWASRVLINFLVFFFTDNPLILWAIFMGLSLYLIFNALNVLFVKKEEKLCNNFIVCLVMLFPFSMFIEAGWIATMTTYLSPIAFGLTALIPIKKQFSNESIGKKEYIFYTISLIYGSNNEQMMVVILGSYLVATVYFATSKRLNLYTIMMTCFSIASCLYTLTCPGNKYRKVAEMESWFPGYDMLDGLDKIELGYSTMLKWLLFDNNIVIITACIFLTFFVWKRYQDRDIRIVSAMPVLVVVFFGPLNEIVGNLFPYAKQISASIPYWGLINEDNRGDLGAFIQFAVMSGCVIILCIEIFLLCQQYYQLIACLTILFTSAASRIAVGFSPTIYASRTRTCAVLTIGIISVIVLIFSILVQNVELLKIIKKRVMPVMYILCGLNILNLWYIIYYTFK